MYQIIFKKAAKKFIDKLPRNEKRRVVAAIQQLPDNGDIKRLQGHKELYRLRVSDYRIIYSVDNGRFIICIIDADNRGQIYYRY